MTGAVDGCDFDIKMADTHVELEIPVGAGFSNINSYLARYGFKLFMWKAWPGRAWTYARVVSSTDDPRTMIQDIHGTIRMLKRRAAKEKKAG